jgi:ABC-2 type transport system ATP-binding protein
MGRAARASRIRTLLEPLGLWERRGEPVGRWSRGMKQKLAMARALLHRPGLLFLDEPTAGLDPVAAATLRDELGTLVSREGVTVFLTTHNLAEAEKLCGRVAVIKQGRVRAIGHPDELKSQTATRAEIIGRGFANDTLARLRDHPGVGRAELQNGRIVLELRENAETAPLVTMIVQSGGQVEEVRKDTGSLEDVFLTLMEEER